MEKVLVTGAAGFIGYHLARRLGAEGYDILGIDNLNDYYDVSLKQARLNDLKPLKNFKFEKMALEDRPAMERMFATFKPDIVLNMGAQAGVRYSLQNPHAYIASNITGFTNVLEGCRHTGVKHLVFASSSSVYGSNKKLPFAVGDAVDHPISLYAATKKANELMAHSYAHLYGIPSTGLRFFTVYGPWGRPDMAVYKFTRALFDGQPIDVYNNGNMKRDFTYIDDIVEGVMRVTRKSPAGGYMLYNIGNNTSVPLTDMISLLESATGCVAKRNLTPMQPGDVMDTFADIDDLIRDTGFRPVTSLETGLGRFVDWFKGYHGTAQAMRA